MASSSCLPPGNKFRPTDVDLIAHYLHKKVFGLPLSSDIVKDCDLYGSQEPWEIWKFYKGEKAEDLYAFTPLKKTSSKGKRICRKVGSGAWYGEDAAQEIQDNRVIGYKKSFRYENKASEHDGEWIMHEYTLLGQDQFVLCRIRRNYQLIRKRHLGKKRKCHEVEHTDENHQSNKCFKVRNEQGTEYEAMPPVNDHDFTKDAEANLTLTEALFPGFGTK
ncbi:hypothetical protein Patl1_13937 [Pistacia atlantica]|uniref:Uncharacterized protein n=1 Tax=Pistacia atlantica TaxID=434234 RepID=A0ACC1AVI1_9ROSI|nr:hypothetical protein Patl1_13937 [Pistacia atlantica]